MELDRKHDTVTDCARGYDRRGQGLWWTVALVAACSLAAGCGGTTFAATSTPRRSRLPAGYVSFADRADHFSIAVPSSWRRIDPLSPGASQALQNLVRANPSLASLFGSNAADLLAKGIKFLALNVNATDRPTVNVVVEPAVGVRDSDLPQLADTLRSQYASGGATVASTTDVSLGGHNALQFAVTFHFARPAGGSLNKNATQDVVAANDFIYILTLAGTSPDLRTIPSTFNVS